nr:hypothetical protein [uncultured Oscillibacter sp.]
MTVFEKVTKDRETLGEVLTSLQAVNTPWDAAFQKAYCDKCELEDCDAQGCPHQEQRNNPLWWLGLEAAP